MAKKRITNHGTLQDSINWGALFESQAKTQAYLDNKTFGFEPKVKDNTSSKKLAKTLGKPNQRHR